MRRKTARPRGWLTAGLLIVLASQAAGGSAARGARARQPPPPASALDTAAELIARGRYGEAEAMLRASFESGHDSGAAGTGRAHYLLGFLLVQTYRYAEAETHLRLAADRRPDEPPWLHAWARSLLELGRNREAITVLDRAIRLEPAPEYLFARAMCLLNVGDTDAAEGALRSCLAARADHVEARFKLAQLLVDRGDYEASLEPLSAVLVADSDHLEARFLLGLSSARVGEPEAARAAFEAVLARLPGHVGALYNLGRLLVDTGRETEGRKRLEQFAAMSTLQDEIDFLRAGVKKNPAQVDGRLLLAEKLIAIGHASEAVEQFLAARDQEPERAELYRLLERALRQAGREREASQAADFGRRLEGRGR